MRGDLVVHHPFIGDRAPLLRVKGRGVILEVLDDELRILCRVENFRFAFVQLLTARHRSSPQAGSRPAPSRRLPQTEQAAPGSAAPSSVSGCRTRSWRRAPAAAAAP